MQAGYNMCTSRPRRTKHASPSSCPPMDGTTSSALKQRQCRTSLPYSGPFKAAPQEPEIPPDSPPRRCTRFRTPRHTAHESHSRITSLHLVRGACEALPHRKPTRGASRNAHKSPPQHRCTRENSARKSPNTAHELINTKSPCGCAMT